MSLVVISVNLKVGEWIVPYHLIKRVCLFASVIHKLEWVFLNSNKINYFQKKINQEDSKQA